jgi:hypothetical protein
MSNPETAPTLAFAASPARVGGDLIAAIAADMAAEIRAYVRDMYPGAAEAGGASFLTSIGNHVRSDIEAVLRGPQDEASIRERLDRRARHRREIARLRRLGDQAQAARGHAGATEAIIGALVAPQEIDHAT